MNIIIPMAGWGTRLRPHTLTVPKPMLAVAGKPIVAHLVKDLVKCVDEKVENVVFIIRSDFGKKIEEQLLQIATSLNIQGHIRYQEEALGTAHAILCAGDFLNTKIIVGFADTLFKMDFKINTEKEGVIFVHRVDEPSAFGVVKLDEQGFITDFIEKPKEFISDLAIIGIYYFKDGQRLSKEMRYLIDNNIKDKGEFQLTMAMENMKNKGLKFEKGEVVEWLDCGNKKATVATNSSYLNYINDSQLVHSSLKTINAIVIQPCFIDESVTLINSVVGPGVSLGKNVTVENSIIEHTIVQQNTMIKNKLIANSMIGNNVRLVGEKEDFSIGDYTVIE